MLVATPAGAVGRYVSVSACLKSHRARDRDPRLIPFGVTREKRILTIDPQLALLCRPLPCVGEGYIGI
jgi:hypothetical protein